MRKYLCLIAALFLLACQNEGAEKDLAAFDSRKGSLKGIAERAKADGNMQAAAQLEAQIIELDQHDIGSFISMGKSLRKMGKQDEAAEILQTGIDLNPENEDGKDALLTELGKTFVEKNDPAAALGRLSLVKKVKTRDFYNTQGVAYDMSGKHIEAQNSYKDGLKLNQTDGLLLNNLALSYMLDKKYKESITILEGLVKRPDATSKYRQNLALAYGMMENRDKALNMLLKDLNKKQAEENLEFYKQIPKR